MSSKAFLIVLGLPLAACAPTDRWSQSPAPSGEVSVMADVARSEWTPPGVVWVDLRRGRYVLSPAPARGSSTRPPDREGRLAAAELGPVRAAFTNAVSQGLVAASCADGGRPAQIVVSNAGPPQLVLTSAAGTVSAPAELGCWSDAAQDLFRILERRFQAEARAPR